jgi:hypothetical protein
MTGTVALDRPRVERTYHTWMEHVRATTAKAQMTAEQHADPKTRAFFTQHWQPMVPAKLALPRWPARELGLQGTVDLLGADTKVAVQTNRCTDPDYELNCAGHVEHVTMRDFADMVECGEPNDTYMTARNRAANEAALAPLWPKVSPLPPYLRPQADAGFVWLGRGAITPLHHDMTHNLLCEVWGRGRLVRTFPPEDRDKLAPLFTGFSRMKWTGDETPDLHPGDYWLHPGEALFIPAGWWHCVRSIGIGMMISYTSFLWPNYWGNDY